MEYECGHPPSSPRDTTHDSSLPHRVRSAECASRANRIGFSLPFHLASVSPARKSQKSQKCQKLSKKKYAKSSQSQARCYCCSTLLPLPSASVSVWCSARSSVA